MKSEFIKKPYQVENYTYEQAIELYKCTMDPIYFMKTYMKVQHPTKGSIPFNMYGYQEEAIKSFLGHKPPPPPPPKDVPDPTIKFGRDSIVMLGRQMGKCVFNTETVNIGYKPKILKKFLLKLFFPIQYAQIFGTRKASP